MSEIAKKISERVKALADLSQHAMEDIYLAGYRDGYREALNLPIEDETKEENNVSEVHMGR